MVLGFLTAFRLPQNLHFQLSIATFFLNFVQIYDGDLILLLIISRNDIRDVPFRVSPFFSLSFPISPAFLAHC